MIIEGVDRLYDAYCEFDKKNPKMRVKLTMKNGEIIIGVPFAVTQPEPDEMDLGNCMYFPGEAKKSMLKDCWDCDVETVELIEVDE